MLILIDTNIILDVLEKREPFYESSNEVLSLCASKKIMWQTPVMKMCDMP